MSEINGYKLMRDWFSFAFENRSIVKPVHVALYSWLVELNNRRGWAKEFSAPASECMAACGIHSYNTYKSALDGLVDFGFVEIKLASKNQFTSNVIALSIFDKAEYKAIDKALMTQGIKQLQSDSQSIDSNTKQQTNKQSNKKQSATLFDDAFDLFWNAYGNKKDKPAALKAWKKVDPSLYPKIMQAIPAYLADCAKTARQIRHPATWLNGECWNDEAAIGTGLPKGQTVRFINVATSMESTMPLEKWNASHAQDPFSQLKFIAIC